jgi:alpha-tubulin suppressor-like RCC1 family protein
LILKGHAKPKGDRKISQLRQVSWLNMKEVTIVSVKCSDAATVVLTADGEIYVLHEYQCRKMASK